MAEQTRRLEGPYEILELTDGEVRRLHVTGWQTGEVVIYPPHQPQGKAVTALRIQVPQAEKDYFPYYWDITGKTLVAQMVPYLQQPGYQDKVFIITKHGVPPKARFTLEVRPT